MLQNHLPEPVPKEFFPRCEAPEVPVFYVRYLVRVLTPVKNWFLSISLQALALAPRSAVGPRYAEVH